MRALVAKLSRLETRLASRPCPACGEYANEGTLPAIANPTALAQAEAHLSRFPAQHCPTCGRAWFDWASMPDADLDRLDELYSVACGMKPMPSLTGEKP